MHRFLGWTFLLPTLLFAETGFYSAKAYRVPSAVELAGNSVVKIVVFNSTTKSLICTGTGFVVDDSKTIWTAGHVVNDSRVNGDNLQIQLQDTLGRTIFDTTSGDVASLAVLGVAGNDMAAIEASDFAKITLSRPLNLRPIAISSMIPKIGQELFSAGFPAIDSISDPTSKSIRDGLPQSRVTMGKSITASEAIEKITEIRNPAQSIDINKTLGAKIIFMDADGYFGQSGSPILNEDGEAVGIFTAIIRSRESGPGEHINTKGLGPNFSSILTP